MRKLITGILLGVMLGGGFDYAEEAPETSAPATAAAEAPAGSWESAWEAAVKDIARNRLAEAAGTMLAAMPAAPASPWSELAYAELPGLLSYLTDMVAAEKAIAARLDKKDLAWTERELLRGLRLQALLLQGKTGEYLELCREQGFARTLRVIGPFSNRNQEGFGYADEISNALPRIDFTAAASGRGRKVYWQNQPVPVSGILHLNTVFYPSEELMAFAAVNVTAPADTAGTLALCTGGAVKVWLNGRELGTDNTYTVAGNHNTLQRLLPVTWKKGANQVLVKAASDTHSQPFLSLRALPLPPAELSAPGSAARADAGALDVSADDEAFAAYQKTLPEEDPDAQDAAKKEGPAAPEADRKKPPFGTDWGALQYFTARAEKDPAAAAALARLYTAYGLDDANFSRGEPLAARALQAAPESPYLNILAALRQKNDNRRRQFLNAAAKTPDGEFARAQLMQMDLSGGFPRRAETAAQAMLREKRSLPNALFTLMQIHGKQERAAEEYACARQLTEIAPYFAPGWLRLAFCAPNPPESTQTLRAAKVFFPEIRVELATRHRQQGKWKEAEEIFRELLALTPDDARLWLLAAECRTAVDDWQFAVRTLKEGLNWLPQAPALWEEAGRILLRSGHQAEGAECLQKALTLNHDNPDLLAYAETLKSGTEKFYQAADIDPASLPGRDASPADYPEYNSLHLLDQAYIQINANGTTRVMAHTVTKIFRPAGVARAAAAQVNYDPERQRVEVVTAKVIQPDGTTVEAPHVVDFPVGPSGQAAAMYSSGQIKEIRLPQAKAGSIVEIKYVIEDFAEPLYFNQFADRYFFGGTEPALTFRYTVSCPEKMPLQWQTSGDAYQPKVRKENGKKIVEWNERDLPGIKPEPAMPPYEEIKPLLTVSTFPDWQAVSAWADRLFSSQMALPPDIKEAAHNLVKGCATREEKIKKIYQFVTDEIRYVSISFGVFGYKPHKAERTFRSRYGDCKDTAVLFTALLREIGVEAYPALVRTRDRGEAPLTLATPRNFNHAIAYVPADPADKDSRAYWLDGTTDYHPFGTIPYMDKGTAALLVKPEGGALVRIDEPRPEDNRKTSVIKIALEKGGAGKITVTDTLRGDTAAAARAAYNQPKQLERMLKVFTQRRFPGSTLDGLKTSDPHDLNREEAEVTYTVTSPNLAVKDGDHYKIPVALVPRNLARLVMLAKREYPLMLGNLCEDNVTVEITLPEGAKLEKIPEDVNLETPSLQYSRKAEFQGTKVTLTEKFVTAGERVSTQQYAEFRDACGIITMASNESLVYGE